MSERAVRVTVAPHAPAIEAAATEAGAVLVDGPEADAIVWTDHRDPEGLRSLLETSPARWVQLPFAGIESFFESGVIGPGRTWTCAKGAYGPATAEHALALMLGAGRLLHEHARRNRWWSRRESHRHRRLAGTTAVIVGTGGIGRALAEMLAPLHVRLIGVNRSGTPLPGAERTVTTAELGDVVGDADWLVIAAALTAETAGMVDAALLGRMRSDAWLINVARGGLVRTDDLVDALRAGRIAGAMLDVTDPEPLPEDHPLWTLDGVLVTSHMANTTEMAIPELSAMVTRNLRAFAEGAPLEGLVDVDAGY